MTRFPFKKLTLALATAGALVLAAPVLASPNHDPAQRLAEKLELSSDQQVQINALFEAHREQMRAEGSRERGDRREARMALHAEIRELLDAEQAEQFDAISKRHQRGYKGRSQHGMGGMFQALDLTEQQRSELRELMREHRGQEGANRAALREQMREILTDEQLAQLEAARAERGQQHEGQRRNRGQRDG